MPKNPNCDNSYCRESDGEVRLYPLGGGGNLILCHSCWAHENRYRYIRNLETKPAKGVDNWPQLAWSEAEIYRSEEPKP